MSFLAFPSFRFKIEYRRCPVVRLTYLISENKIFRTCSSCCEVGCQRVNEQTFFGRVWLPFRLDPSWPALMIYPLRRAAAWTALTLLWFSNEAGATVWEIANGFQILETSNLVKFCKRLIPCLLMRLYVSIIFIDFQIPSFETNLRWKTDLPLFSPSPLL